MLVFFGSIVIPLNIKTNQLFAMDIITEDQITGPVARKMRQHIGLTQKAFWNPVGVQQSVACRYELDAGADIPQAVRILIVARYISGLRIAASTPNEVAHLSKLGAAQAKQAGEKNAVRRARASIDKAVSSLTDAADALQNLNPKT